MTFLYVPTMYFYYILYFLLFLSPFLSSADYPIPFHVYAIFL
jgi:hypothetical protein